MMRAEIRGGFWARWLGTNAQNAIYLQWEQLERSGCIENFRIAAKLAEGVRLGWFFADSDAFKWLEAAARISGAHPEPKLAGLIDDFIVLLGKAQADDGYLFTYNQIHFPETRWQNLQIEHELYCHGHLIEAGVTHYESSGRDDLLKIACKAADRIVADFRGKGPKFTPGHEEIEIALLRLHQVNPRDGRYLAMARQFIEMRGRTAFFGFSLLKNNLAAGKRIGIAQKANQSFQANHPEHRTGIIPPANRSRSSPLTTFRWLLSALSGKFFQQHAPVRRQNLPVGHAVRFTYLQTAKTMLARLGGDESLMPSCEKSWERMVERRMYVTGGIGSVPGLEGFGRDYELDPEAAYAETCAALGSLMWNWEMLALGGDVRYSDLFEWQLYNAVLVGMGWEGTSYLFNNPLACRGEVERQPWYSVPCCPSNLSRTWANLGKYVASYQNGILQLHQFINCQLDLPVGDNPAGESESIRIQVDSKFPWQGEVIITIVTERDPGNDIGLPIELQFRQPSWTDGVQITLNGEKFPSILSQGITDRKDPASGYDPRLALLHTIRHVWKEDDHLQIQFGMPIVLRQAHARLRQHHQQVAVTRGPLVYCLEDLDNPGVDLFSARLDTDSLGVVEENTQMGGFTKITGRTTKGDPLTFIPYYLWGNRGRSQMTVWVNT